MCVCVRACVCVCISQAGINGSLRGNDMLQPEAVQMIFRHRVTLFMCVCGGGGGGGGGGGAANNTLTHTHNTRTQLYLSLHNQCLQVYRIFRIFRKFEHNSQNSKNTDEKGAEEGVASNTTNEEFYGKVTQTTENRRPVHG